MLSRTASVCSLMSMSERDLTVDQAWTAALRLVQPPPSYLKDSFTLAR